MLVSLQSLYAFISICLAFQTHQQATLVDTSASGYANSGGLGIETVDECGLRFLMAMKQHEYLLRYLPPVQKQRLRSRLVSLLLILSMVV